MKRLQKTFFDKWPEFLIESIVIVASIWGAFALENWNDNQNKRTFEKATLSQILVNLKQDRERLLFINQRFTRAVSATNRILASGEAETDSLKYWLGDIVQFERFQPLTNAFDLLKSKGLDVMSNQNLAFQLGKYYDDDSRQMVRSIGDIEGTFNNDWLPVLKQQIVDLKFREYVMLADWNQLLGDGEPRRIIILNRDNYSSACSRITNVLAGLDGLIASVEQEIKK